jgi:hypothetical protein
VANFDQIPPTTAFLFQAASANNELKSSLANSDEAKFEADSVLSTL